MITGRLPLTNPLILTNIVIRSKGFLGIAIGGRPMVWTIHGFRKAHPSGSIKSCRHLTLGPVWWVSFFLMLHWRIFFQLLQSTPGYITSSSMLRRQPTVQVKPNLLRQQSSASGTIPDQLSLAEKFNSLSYPKQLKSNELYNNRFISRYVCLNVYICTAHTFVYDPIWRSLKPQISSSSELQNVLLQNNLNLCCICWNANDFHIIIVYHHCLYICGPLTKRATLRKWLNSLPSQPWPKIYGFTDCKTPRRRRKNSLALRLAPISSLGLWHQKPSWNASIRCIFVYIYICVHNISI